MISLWKIEDGKTNILAQFSVGSDELVRPIAIPPNGTTLFTPGAHLRFWDSSEVRKKSAVR
jgi:hypothetical protein